MAGYSGFSKSNNAVYAEENDRFPATKLGKILGISPAAIKAVLTPCEWHHTSKHYNKTNYYDLEEANEKIDQLKAWKPEKKDEQVFEGCTVCWIEWSGTRNYPRKIEHKIINVTVTKKGDWFHFDHVINEKLTVKMKKNGKTNGFSVTHNNKIINNSWGF
jgi:hypothetical protein